MQLTYVGPHDAVEVPFVGVVNRGESLEVPARVAGTEPTDDKPGEGLLAQANNWQRKTEPEKETEK